MLLLDLHFAHHHTLSYVLNYGREFNKISRAAVNAAIESCTREKIDQDCHKPTKNPQRASRGLRGCYQKKAFAPKAGP